MTNNFFSDNVIKSDGKEDLRLHTFLFWASSALTSTRKPAIVIRMEAGWTVLRGTEKYLALQDAMAGSPVFDMV